MEHHDTIVIGAGQAGLAMSRCLQDAGIGHVVLERGRLAERWRSERWDSLRMLTPNWMTRLPGRGADVEEPDGFMSKDDLVELLESYAASFGAPVREQTAVTRVEETAAGFMVTTEAGGKLTARNVVVATGQCGRPVVPDFAEDIDPAIEQLHAARYRNPVAHGAGGVLVVGAGASGLQIAAELAEAGREVTLAVGRHARGVRRYRGRDLWWWLDEIGSLSQTVDDVSDIDAARRTPSLGLTGAGGGRDIDLGALARGGVTLVGRVRSATGTGMVLGDNLAADAREADGRLRHLLDRFDAHAHARGLDAELDAPTRPVPVRLEAPPPRRLDLADAGITTVVWATGYRQHFPWLAVDVLDGRGEIRHHRGVTESPGLYVLGLRFQWTRGSHFLDGVGRDAEFLTESIVARADSIAVA